VKKQWFAFDLGPNGGISSSATSGPLKSLGEAKEWATTRFPSTKVPQIGIAELVMVAERECPPVSFKDVTEVTLAVQKAA
jgi:hypothetical protein